jgi:AcrR family transcriptional regulator
MARWDPDAGSRLQQAAMALFFDRGYDAVTVADIADSAGLTKRTFFRHFADKREVVFAGAPAFQAGVVAAVLDAPADVPAAEAAITALADTSGAQLAQWAQYARARQELVASSADLRERALIKTASLTAAVAEALRHRGVPSLTADLAAHGAVTAFSVGYDRWVDGDGRADLPALVRETLADLRRSLSTG